MRVYQQLDQLRKLTEGEILLRHIATYDLYAPDPQENAEIVRQKMDDLKIDIAPLKEHPYYYQYIVAKELADGHCGKYAHSIDVTMIVAETLPAANLFEMLQKQPFLFVLQGSGIAGIVTKADLQRVPVRILMFGLITLLEMNLRESIRDYYEDDGWTQMLNEKRFKNAQDIQAERISKDASIGLLECTQLCDLKEIIARGPLLQEIFTGLSKNQFRNRLERIEYYRNDLAHAQALDLDLLTLYFSEIKQCLEASDAWLRARVKEDALLDSVECRKNLSNSSVGRKSVRKNSPKS